MNQIKCPKCGVENAFGLVFCTSCGASLYAAANTQPQSPPNETVVLAPPKSKINRNMAIFGGLGCLALLLGGIALVGGAYFIGSRKTDVVNTGNYNADTANIAVLNNRNSASKANKIDTDNNSTSPNIDDTDVDSDLFLPSSVGSYEQQSTSRGNPGDDFPGADEVNKATYTKKTKSVEFILAKFSTKAAAEKSYTEFLAGFKSSGAKILGKQKAKNKAGVNNGEITLFTFEKKWNALVYTERNGVRFTAPDRYTLIEFTKEIDKSFGDK